jgi:hypothetical protein
MRTPSRKRKKPARRFGSPPEGVDLDAVANRAHYVGSPEHKDAPSFAGQPRPRADATICDRSFAGRLADINQWLKAAILARQFSEFWDHAHFPRYVWHREGERVFEARVVNAGDGSYKGYELKQDEWPEEFH